MQGYFGWLGGEWEVSDESRRERERGRGRGTRQIEERPRAHRPPWKRSRESGATAVVGAQSSAGQASLVRVEAQDWVTGKV